MIQESQVEAIDQLFENVHAFQEQRIWILEEQEKRAQADWQPIDEKAANAN